MATSASDQLPRWPVWVLGGLVLGLCGLVSASRSVPTFLLPSQVAERSGEGPTGERPHTDSWDYWTGPGVPLETARSVGVLAVAAFAVAVVVFVLLAVRGIRWRRRRRSETEPAPVAVARTFDRVAAASTTEDAVADAIGRLDSAAELDRVIVDCWRAVLTAGADAGLPRTDTETSTEYVDRLSAALTVDAAPVHTIAGLYREARFSDHRLSDAARGQAGDALRRLRADLSRLRALR